MNICKSSFIILSVSFVTSVAQAQGTFLNLKFEQAHIPAGTPANSLVPISEALPDWSAYYTSSLSGTEPTTQVGYDFISTGGPVISLVDAQAATPIQGIYSAYLFGGVGTSATISQSGTIAAGTQSLMMDAWSYGASPVVAINGVPIDMIPLETFANYTLYGGAIPSADVGPSVTLSFTEPPPSSGGPSEFELDNISFSQTVVPEPSVVELIAVGGLLFGARKWLARRC